MKILLVNKFHNVKGGSETYYFALGDLLAKHGHEVIYFSMKDEKNRPCEQEKYFVDHVDFNKKMSAGEMAKASLKMLYSREAKQKFEQLILAEKPDIIHLNIFQSQLTGSIVDVAEKYGIPMVYTAHDLKSVCPNYQMMNHGQLCEKCLDGKYFHCFREGCMKDSKAKSLLATLEAEVYRLRKTYSKIDLIVTPSAFYKKKIDAAGIAKCPVIHMTNFLPENAVYQYGTGRGEYFLYFGRLSREKGILTLVEAYAKANVSLPLYLVGTGPQKEAIEELIQREGLQDRVLLLGFKSGQELQDIVKGALCVCLPSEWYENGPYSIMEAQALGRPAIVSSNGGLPELVKDGETGLIAEPCNAEDLKNKLELCERKTDWNNDAITAYAETRYNAELYVKNLLPEYEKLLKNRK